MDATSILVSFAFGAAIGGALGALITYLYSAAKVAQLEAERVANADKLGWLGRAQQDMQKVFGAIAFKTLRKSTEVFAGQIHQPLNERLRTHAEQIGDMKSVLQKEIQHLDQQVRQLEVTREGAYKSLTSYLSELQKAQGELRSATEHLYGALKTGPIRGRWGEIQLRRIVELAGMLEHVSFHEQPGGLDGGRPDMAVQLPNKGQVLLDSKCPLQHYLDAVAAGNDTQKRSHCLLQHSKVVKQTVDALADRKYWEQFDMATEFVIMFVPIESCLVTAFEHDPDLLDYAAQKRVILATPLTLLAFLRAVAYGWQQFTMSKNAKEILAQGKELYRRTNTWLDHLREVERKLTGLIDAHNKCVSSLNTRFLPAARRFQELSALPDEIEELSLVSRGVSIAPEGERFDSELGEAATTGLEKDGLLS